MLSRAFRGVSAGVRSAVRAGSGWQWSRAVCTFPLSGSMQKHDLMVSDIIEFAGRHHPEVEVVSRTVEGPIHRYTYKDAALRARKVAKAVNGLVGHGDRIATMAWNGYRHFELYFGVSGAGAVMHTLNPRLFAEQLVYIVNHAEDKYICVDLTFVPLMEALADKMPGVQGYIIMTDEAHMPDTTLRNTICYETLVESQGVSDYEWPVFDENHPSSLCYTSGTTGAPKGVLYSHRSNVLHSYAECMPDGLGLSQTETVLPVVPLFHANGWGLAYAAPMTGTTLVFPGAGMDGKSVWELLDAEKVTLAAGVPTVWLMLLQFLAESGEKLPHLKRTLIGGSAVPEMMIRKFLKDYDVEVLHAWGMTEMSPLGTVSTPKRKHVGQSIEDSIKLQLKQGRSLFGVDMKIVDDDGNALPHDGTTFGRLLVKGPWVVDTYFKAEESALEDGWFDTGDVAVIDEDGFMQITDRSKDIIKSGGEWISSVELENEAMSHPDVAEAAAIGMPHPKWDERPLLIVVPAAGTAPSKDSIVDHLKTRVAKWWLPDDVVFVEELPHTATGKILKTKLREDFGNHKLDSGDA